MLFWAEKDTIWGKMCLVARIAAVGKGWFLFFVNQDQDDTSGVICNVLM